MAGNTWQFQGAGSERVIPDPGNGGVISIGDRIIGLCELDDTGGALTRTVSPPQTEGQMLILHKSVGSSDIVVTFPVAFDATHTQATLGALDDIGIWISVRTGSTLKWWLIVDLDVV